jgi:hypothetical protein
MVETSVVNVRGKKLGVDYDVYVGRVMRAAPYRLPIKIPKLSKDGEVELKAGYFGNPFPVGKGPFMVKGQRYEDAMDAYRAWFEQQTVTDAGFLGNVLRLKGLRLGCWCVDEHGRGECHAQVIAAFVDGRRERR